MSISKVLAEDVLALVSANKIYNDMESTWKYLLESYLGGEDYRRAGHLTRYQLETDAEYSARLRNTPLDNHCASVVSVYNSFLFREEPDREFNGLDALEELESFLRDADHDGRSFDSFMKDVSTWSSVFGHCWIIVAKPDVGAVTRADELAQGVRPYVNLLTPLAVLDWRWKRQPSGRYELDYLRYVEDANGDVKVVKEWTKETITTYEVDVGKRKLNSEIVEINGLGKIPAVIAYNGRSPVRGIGVSDINDIADMQKFLYNSTSEIFQSIQLDSHPSLVATPDTTIGTGSGAIIKMPDNLDPGLKPYVLDFGGADTNNILAAMKHMIDAVDKMANTGAVRATESRTMSGVAMETEFQLLNARLSEKADNLELAEEQIWQFWAEYMGYQWMGSIEYPGSFNIRDTNSEITQLQQAKSAATDPKVLAAIDSKILDWLDLDEDELASIANPTILNPGLLPEGEEYYEFSPHIMVNPLTGEEVLAETQQQHIELANQGYYHKQGE